MDNVDQVKTEQDLKKWLDQQQQQLAELSQQVNELKAQSSTRRLELAEHKIQRLSEEGMPYDQAFSQVVDQLEEDEHKARTRAEQATRERVELELEELTPQEEQAILELEDRDDDN